MKFSIAAGLALSGISASLFILPASSAQAATAPQAFTPAMAATPVIAPPPTDYVLSPDDQLTVMVIGHPDMTQDVTILSDGSFAYPVAGIVHAAGLTLSRLTNVIAQQLSTQFNQPQVSVVIRAAKPRQVSVLGAVKAPGIYDCKGNSHLLDALAQSGGPSQPATQTRITLIGPNGSSSTEIDAVKLLIDGDPASNEAIDAGDTLLVQPKDQATSEVQVNGEVKSPGYYAVPAGGAPIRTLINEAGGVTTTAGLSEAQLSHDGAAHSIDLGDYNTSLTGGLSDTMVYPGDTILIPTSTYKVAVMGDVHTPGTVPILPGRPMTVSQALEAAGGPNQGADETRAYLVHRTPDGKVLQKPINVASILKGDEKSPDITMQPGDALYVPAHKTGSLRTNDIVSLLSPLGWFIRR